MDIIEKYEIYKKGLVPRGTSTTLQKFFKTNPTVDQLLYMAQMNREEAGFIVLGYIIYLVFGIAIGLFFSLSWMVTP
jgi:hypothetical protein